VRSLSERLAAKEILVADGATGTLLLERGLQAGQPPESITLANPEVLEEIARLYVDAGADIIETNTFGASPLRLAHYGLDDRIEQINRDAVHAARAAAGDRAHVAASVGPSGALLQPMGEATPEQLFDGFRRQLECLVAAGVDCVIVETMVDLTEAQLAVRAAKDIAPETPVFATMTFDATPRGFFTIMGVSVEAAAAGLREAGADAVGSNCGTGIDEMIAIAMEFGRWTDPPIIIQPNAGLPQTEGGKIVYGDTPDFMAQKSSELLAAGASVIGGCCGTTPDHVAAIRAMVDAR
jgi:5-methyltetrahydrofolate--homocysteine methyltransferase